MKNQFERNLLIAMYCGVLLGCLVLFPALFLTPEDSYYLRDEVIKIFIGGVALGALSTSGILWWLQDKHESNSRSKNKP